MCDCPVGALQDYLFILAEPDNFAFLFTAFYGEDDDILPEL